MLIKGHIKFYLMEILYLSSYVVVFGHALSFHKTESWLL